MHVPHVAVVDDEPDLREMVQEYLGRHGLLVSTADGG
jgi:DNA-binding response OmpR family regulator